MTPEPQHPGTLATSTRLTNPDIKHIVERAVSASHLKKDQAKMDEMLGRGPIPVALQLRLICLRGVGIPLCGFNLCHLSPSDGKVGNK